MSPLLGVLEDVVFSAPNSDCLSVGRRVHPLPSFRTQPGPAWRERLERLGTYFFPSAFLTLEPISTVGPERLVWASPLMFFGLVGGNAQRFLWDPPYVFPRF